MIEIASCNVNLIQIVSEPRGTWLDARKPTADELREHNVARNGADTHTRFLVWMIDSMRILAIYCRGEPQEPRPPPR